MTHRLRSFVLWAACVLALVMLAASVELWAQTKTKKPQGRLPPYYNQVVTDKQKDAIYRVWNKYFSEIDKLEAQLKELKTRRDAEINALLTDEQKVRVKQLREEEEAQQEANRRVKEAAKKKETAKQ